MLPLLPNEEAPFVVPVSSPIPTSRNISLTPLVLDERAIARLLELMLDRAGLTISEVARRLGVSPQAVRQYIHGRRRPSLLQVLKIAETCGARLLIEYPR
jgi:transcriptional regulator with XRE-family HTH domain